MTRSDCCTPRPTSKRSAAWTWSLAEAFPELPRDVVGGAILERLEPALAPGLWACRVGIGYPVQPGASTYAYATLAERRGVTIRQGRAADARRPRRHGRPGSSSTAGRSRPTRSSSRPGHGRPPSSTRPARGGRSANAGASSSSSELPAGPTHVLEEAEIGAAIGTGAHEADPDLADFSLVPLAGIASVGSTFLAREPDPAAWVEPILRRASSFVPGVADAPIRGTRACARPQSADGRPLIGRVAGRRGLVVCAGHGSWGISTGPASARLAADLILGREPLIPAELDPARFGAPPSC